MLTYPRTLIPCSRAFLTTGSKRSKDVAMVQFRFLSEKPSDAEAKMEISEAPG